MQLNGPQTKQTSKWQTIYRSLCSFLLEIARLLGMGQMLGSPEKVSLCSLASGAPGKCWHEWEPPIPSHRGTEWGENMLIGFKVGHQASALALFPQRQMGGLKNPKTGIVHFNTFLRLG